MSIKTGSNSNKFLTRSIVTGIHEFIPMYISTQVYKLKKNNKLYGEGINMPNRHNLNQVIKME